MSVIPPRLCQLIQTVFFVFFNDVLWMPTQNGYHGRKKERGGGTLCWWVLSQKKPCAIIKQLQSLPLLTTWMEKRRVSVPFRSYAEEAVLHRRKAARSDILLRVQEYSSLPPSHPICVHLAALFTVWTWARNETMIYRNYQIQSTVLLTYIILKHHIWLCKC